MVLWHGELSTTAAFVTLRGRFHVHPPFHPNPHFLLNHDYGVYPPGRARCTAIFGLSSPRNAVPLRPSPPLPSVVRPPESGPSRPALPPLPFALDFDFVHGAFDQATSTLRVFDTSRPRNCRFSQSFLHSTLQGRARLQLSKPHLQQQIS
jgi:hypothetical protein